MKYIIYKITNKLNGKIYIGQHATTNVNDSYMGSGRGIKRAIARYGIQHFQKDIIAVFDDAEAMDELEAFIVDEEFVKSNKNYNGVVGGSKWVGYGLVVTLKDIDTGELTQTNPVEARELVKTGKYARVEAMTGRVVMLKDDKMRYIDPDDVEGMLADGWIIEHPLKDNIVMYDPSEDRFKRVHKDNEQEMLNQGWERRHTSKGRIRLYHPETLENRFVLPEQVDGLLGRGFVKGNGYRQGMVAINKEGHVKYITEDEVEQYPAEGWVRGTGSTKLWMHKEGNLIQADPEEISKYEDEGWVKGAGSLVGVEKGSVHVSKDGTVKVIKPSELQQYLVDGWIKKGRKRRTGKWVNNGKTNKLISDETEYVQYIDDGWVDGKRAINKGKVYVHDNNGDKLIDKGELKQYLTNGWVKGRIRKDKRK